MSNWFQITSMPWWAGIGPLLAGFMLLIDHLAPARMGLVGVILQAGLDGTPPFALIYMGVLLLWAQRKFFPHL